ncbi:MAG: VPA1267 family protein [Sulfuritalea sp.]|nr:VPA1267 family protein [Sulfuritalea sp.]
MSRPGLSGQQIAATNAQRFNDWIAERDAAADWPDYIRQGKLNRSEIASECSFALSVVRQNPAVKTVLEKLEARLLASGILQPAIAAPSPAIQAGSHATSQSIDKRIMAAKAKAEQRVKQLEEQNAALKAEVRDLRDQLKTYRHLDEHLCTTGRLLRA